jgi:signal peptidase I
VQPAPAQCSPNIRRQSASVPPRLRELRRWTRYLTVAVGLASFIVIYVYRPVQIEGASMNPLLWDRDLIFVNRIVYRFEPIRRGDIIVFSYPLDPSASFIKRVVGLPGETIEIRGGRLYVNATELADQFVPPSYLDQSNLSEFRIPANTYFVMGDHRESSNDSRVFGPLPRAFIHGKAIFAYWPLDHFGLLTSPSTVRAASR